MKEEEKEDKWCHNDKPPIYICDLCGEAIYEGDVYYDINGEVWCEECIDSVKGIAGESVFSL